MDTPLRIRASGLPSGCDCTVRARAVEPGGRAWTAHAVYRVPESEASGASVQRAAGAIDLSVQQPVSGTFSDADPMGLVWSLAPEPATGEQPFGSPVVPVDLSPVGIDFELVVEDEVVATARAERLQMAPGVRREEVSAGGVYGVLFLPPGKGPHPAVTVLSGMPGGVVEGAAALLASHGYAAFALAYFNYAALPEGLIEIPLEYFGRGLEYLKRRPEVDEARLALLGSSRGGEGALLVAATYPEVRAVVARTASGVMWFGLPHDPEAGYRASWSRNGEPLPFIGGDFDFTGKLEEEVAAGYPITYAPRYARHYDYDPEMSARAEIPVERISGPVLLLSAGDDRMWPSARLCRLVEERLARHRFAHAVIHHSYPEAGHIFPTPYVPTTNTTLVDTPGGEAKIAFGGTPEANYRAGVAAWHRTLEFLASHV